MYERKDTMRLKKFTRLALSATLAFTLFTQSTYAYTINEVRSEEYLASGIHRQNIERFTSEGWQNLNILTIDTTNNANEIKAIFNTGGIANRSNVRDILNANGAVAAVNGDYFNYIPIPTSIGLIVNNGKIVTSAQMEQNKLPSFYITNSGDSHVDYITQTIYVVNPINAQKYHVSAINKAFTGYKPLSLLTRDWNTKSFGKKTENMTEVLVIGGVVADVRTNGEAFDIPADGYVLSQKDSPLANLTIGTPLQLQVNSNIDYNNLKFAMGGGSIILNNGVAMQTNIVNKGRHPRTGIGVTSDYSKIMIVTCDGRNGYAGFGQKEFGELFKSLGCYNAINLDGGGSTTLVKKTKAMDKAEVVNHPSGGSLRSVVSAVGIFSSDVASQAQRLELKLAEEKAFPGMPIKYEVKAYDARNNPVRIDPSSLSLSSTSGVTFNGTEAIANGEGMADITVSYNGITASANFEVLSQPVELKSSIEKINAKAQEKYTIKDIVGIDRQGRSAKIPTKMINFSIYGNIGSMSGNVFTASNVNGFGYITMGYNETYKNIPVTIGFKEKALIDFENLNNLKASSYPNDKVKTSIKMVDERVKGKKAVELSYDFSNYDDSRASYLSFKKPMLLEGRPKRLGIWVKGDASKAMLKASIKDSDGFLEQITFTEKINFADYKYLQAEIPDNDAYPYTLLNIYVGSSNSDAMVKSKVLIDSIDLLYEHEFENALDNSSVFTDSQARFIPKTAGGEYLLVSGYDQKQNDKFKGANQKIINKLNRVDTAVVLMNYEDSFKNAINTKLVKNGEVFSSNSTANAYILNLNTKKRSLRLSDSKQWKFIVDNLKNIAQKNVVVTMTNPVFSKGGFTDKKEANLLHSKLKELVDMGKNVYVVSGSNESSVKVLDKVRYINVFNRPIKTKAELNKRDYVQFTFNMNGEAGYIISKY